MPGENDPQTVRELLAKAADALGGADRLRAIRSLSITGTFRRVFPDRERSGTYQVYFVSPDKYKKVESAEVSKGVQIGLVQVLDKNVGRNGACVRAGGIELNLDKLGVRTPPLSSNARRQIRAGLTLHALAWFLSSPAHAGVQFGYGGRAEAYGAHAFILDMKGADDFAARVFLDSKTYRPLSLIYRGRPPVITLDKSVARRDAQAYETEIEVCFSDYRVENGIVSPRNIRAEAGGKLVEEFEMKTYRVNPPEAAEEDFVRN